MQTGSFKKLEGTVEVDETFVGGLEKNKHKDKKQNRGRGSVGKAVVLGVLNRGDAKRISQIRCKVIADTKQTHLARGD